MLLQRVYFFLSELCAYNEPLQTEKSDCYSDTVSMQKYKKRKHKVLYM